MIVAAPSKTPRAKGDRVKSDRKDAELLARLLLAGQLEAVAIPPDWLEAIRHLARTREQVRRDLGRARHRVSKLLLVEGRVYPGKTTWNADHRRWLAAQQFAFAATELAFIDLLAEVHGLPARRERSTSATAAGRRRTAVADGRQAARVSRRRHADRAGAAPRTRTPRAKGDRVKSDRKDAELEAGVDGVAAAIPARPRRGADIHVGASAEPDRAGRETAHPVSRFKASQDRERTSAPGRSRDHAIRRFSGLMLADNTAIQKLMTSIGPVISRTAHGATVELVVSAGWEGRGDE